MFEVYLFMLKTNPLLKTKWLAELSTLVNIGDGQVASKLYDRYAEPNRYYHGVGHLHELMNIHLFGKGYGVIIPGYYRREVVPYRIATVYAILGHDSVYKMNSQDVKNSLDLFSNTCEDYDPDMRQDVFDIACDQILATETHKHEDALTAERHMIDVDLTALAAPPEVFYANTIDLKREAAAIGGYDVDEWNTGRKKFAESMLNRDNIFGTRMFSHLEEAARRNLEGSLNRIY